MSAPGTRVVSAVRSGKLRERWADPQYAEKERARLRAMSQEQREALAFYRQHRGDPQLAPSPDPASTPLPSPPPAATAPRPRRRASSKAPGRQPASSTPPATMTPPAAVAAKPRGTFFLGRHK